MISISVFGTRNEIEAARQNVRFGSAIKIGRTDNDRVTVYVPNYFEHPRKRGKDYLTLFTIALANAISANRELPDDDLLK